jgi:vancomycin resistance protein YoaR
VFALLLFLAAAERIRYHGKVMPGVHVAGAHVSGASEADARAQLDALATTMQQRVIEAKAGPNELHAAASDLGVRVDTAGTLAAARHDGRSGNPFDAVFGFLLRRMRHDDIGLKVHINEHAVDAAVARWDRESVTGLRNAGLAFHGTDVAVTPARAGRGIDTTSARTMLRAAATDPSDHPIALPLITRQPQVTSAEAEAVATRARRVLTGVYTVHSAGHTFTITAPEVGRAIEAPVRNGKLTLTINGDHLRDAVTPPIRALGTAPVDATFTASADGAVSVVPSRDGTGPDFAAIGRAILAGQRDFDTPFGPVHPERDTKWAEKLGITELVSSFTTHHPCCAARVDNIHRAADLVNNTIIEPGQLFSLNQAIGPRTQARGFVQAPVIADNEFGTDFGGGVSQLSTTTFNAAWWGGYEIVQHTPHSLYITRYPMGREATLSFPGIDMQFRNDTTHGIWLRTSYTGTSVTVTLYGNNDRRTVRETYGTCSVGPVYDTVVNGAPEPRCLHIISTTPIVPKQETCPVKNPGDDPNKVCATLQPGQTKAGAGGETGYVVEFYRTITQPGHSPRVEHFLWRYAMTPNITLVGPGTPTTTAPTTTVPSATTSAPPTPTTLKH